MSSSESTTNEKRQDAIRNIIYYYTNIINGVSTLLNTLYSKIGANAMRRMFSLTSVSILFLCEKIFFLNQTITPVNFVQSGTYYAAVYFFKFRIFYIR